MFKNPNKLQELLNTDDFIKQISVDCVVFGYHDNILKVLLLKYYEIDIWAVPGGFILKNENLDNAVTRIVYERTNLKNLYLEQFYTFGEKNRTKNNYHKQNNKNLGIKINDSHWIFDRFISVGYYVLIDYTKVNSVSNELHETDKWFDISNLPNLTMDHKEMILKAWEHLKKNLDYKIVGTNLLPEKFTMKELQILYETILETKFRRNNFQRKILNLNILERHEKLFSGSPNKAPFLYSFKNN